GVHPARKIAHEKMIVVLGRHSCAWIEAQPGGAMSDVPDRRNQVSRVICWLKFPEQFVIPRTQLRLLLPPQAPAVLAGFHHVQPASFVALVAVIVSRPEIAELVKRKFLWIAQARREQLEVRSIRIAAKHRARIRI